MLQGGEIIIILALALIVLGPKRLPELARKMGQWTAELRTTARDMRRALEAEVGELKEVGDELKEPLDEIKKPLEELKKPFDEIKRDIDESLPSGHEWTGPKPVSGPTPEDAMRDLEEIEGKSGDEDGA